MYEDEPEESIPVPINNDLERRIADAFVIFDHANNKSVDVRDISTIVRSLGCCPSEAAIQEIIVATEDHDEAPGTVHLAKFLPHMCEVINEHKYQPATPTQLLQAFQTLDTENHGYLTKEQISTLMTQDGEPFSQDELDEMLEIALDPHTQTVPYEYYINQLMCNLPPHKDVYAVAAKVESEKPPPPPPPRRFSELMAAMTHTAD